MSSTPAGEPRSILAPEVRGAALAVFSTVALAAFEGLAVAAALPQVAADLGGVALLPWVITAYLFASGVATIAAGALVDRLGVAIVFRWAVVVFVLGATVAGFAPTMPTLVASRVIQGVGAGAVNAVSLAAVGLIFPRRLVSRAFAANSTVWGVMGVAGPAVAAGLLTVASWRWIFLVNIPLGAVALAAGWRTLPSAGPGEQTPTRLDPVDIALLSGFTGAVLLAVDRLDWVSVPVAALAVGCGALVLRRGRGDPAALVRPAHVITTPLGPLAWSVALMLVGAIGIQSYVPLYVSGARGAGPGATAWSVVFFTVGWTVGANGSSRLSETWTPMRTVTVGLATAATSCAALSIVVLADLALALAFVCLFVAGVGTGTATNAALTLVRTLTVDAELGRAVAAHQFVRNQGFATGIALAGAVLLVVVGSATGDVEAVRDVIGEGSGAGVAATATIADAIGDGFGLAALVGAGVMTLGAWPLAVLRRALRDAPRRPHQVVT